MKECRLAQDQPRTYLGHLKSFQAMSGWYLMLLACVFFRKPLWKGRTLGCFTTSLKRQMNLWLMICPDIFLQTHHYCFNWSKLHDECLLAEEVNCFPKFLMEKPNGSNIGLLVSSHLRWMARLVFLIVFRHDVLSNKQLLDCLCYQRWW